MSRSRSLPVANTIHVISEWPNWWIQRLPETIHRGIAIACSCNCHYLCFGFLHAAWVHSVVVIIARATGFGMGVRTLSRPLGWVGVLPMLDAALDITRRIESVCEVHPGAGGIRLLVFRFVGQQFIDHPHFVGWLEATCWVISATRELFCEDKWLEFRPWIVEDP